MRRGGAGGPQRPKEAGDQREARGHPARRPSPAQRGQGSPLPARTALLDTKPSAQPPWHRHVTRASKTLAIPPPLPACRMRPIDVPSHAQKVQIHFQAELPMLDTHVHAVSPPGRVGSAPEPTGLTLTPLASPTTQRQSLRHPTATFLRALNARPPRTRTSRHRTNVR